MWQDVTREDRIRVMQVDPWALDVTRGELTGIMLDKCSVTFGYDADNRVSGKLSCVDDGSWVDGSWLRIVHECPGYGYANELATLIPSAITRTDHDGHTQIDVTLQSVLWALSEDRLPSHFTIGAGAQTPEVFDRIMAITGKTGLKLPGCSSHRYGDAVVYEIGDTLLSDLFDICKAAGNRLDVDGHGRITMGPDVGASKAPDWEIDADDPRTILLNEGVTREDKPGSVANRSIVTYKKNDVEITAEANLPGSKRASSQRRGYTVAKTHTENDLNPATYDTALAKANEYLREDGRDAIESSAKLMYFPARAGDVLRLHNAGGTSDNLVTQADVSLKDMTVDITMEQEV